MASPPSSVRVNVLVVKVVSSISVEKVTVTLGTANAPFSPSDGVVEITVGDVIVFSSWSISPLLPPHPASVRAKTRMMVQSDIEDEFITVEL